MSLSWDKHGVEESLEPVDYRNRHNQVKGIETQNPDRYVDNMATRNRGEQICSSAGQV